MIFNEKKGGIDGGGFGCQAVASIMEGLEAINSVPDRGGVVLKFLFELKINFFLKK